MRLLDTESFKIRDFPQDRIPDYSILSHTWSTDEEISFAEFQSVSASIEGWTPYKHSGHKGYEKITGLCRQALADNHRYVWVDTCCIDKSSSAELSEAINSMYRWYSEALCCYVYLDDMDDLDELGGVSQLGNMADLGDLDDLYDMPIASALAKELAYCRWFTRGWCLQELLAPLVIKFYNRHWTLLGNKFFLGGPISRITGIPMTVLKLEESVFSKSIAQRMSWASRRETTREEDIAYSLMGIFDVNMPMLYGEGRKAFRRLQEEILKVSTDPTIFAWTHHFEGASSQSSITTGLLADHPSNFRLSADFEDVSQLLGYTSPSQQFSSGRGIYVDVFLPADADGQSQPFSEPEPVKAILKCARDNDPSQFAAIWLQKSGNNEAEYFRFHSSSASLLDGLLDASLLVDISLGSSRLEGLEKNVFVPHNTSVAKAKPMRYQYLQIVQPEWARYKPRLSVLTLPSDPGPFLAQQDLSPDFLPSSLSMDFYKNVQYRKSDPEKFVYNMPWQPGKDILRIAFGDTLYSVCVHLRRNEQAQVTYDVHYSSNGWLSNEIKTIQATPLKTRQGAFIAEWKSGVYTHTMTFTMSRGWSGRKIQRTESVDERLGERWVMCVEIKRARS